MRMQNGEKFTRKKKQRQEFVDFSRFQNGFEIVSRKSRVTHTAHGSTN